MSGFRLASHQDVAGLQVAMNQSEVVKERERAQRLCGERHERRRALARDRRDDGVTLDVLHRELRSAGLAIDEQLVNLDQARMTKRRERRELTGERRAVVGIGLEELLQRESGAGSQAIFDEHDPSRPAFTERPQLFEALHPKSL